MKKGFTLAEVLITLAIIGVVAALTIPTVIAKYNQHAQYTAFMKMFNTLQTAFNLSMAENGDPSGWILGDGENKYEEYVQNYFGKYLKVAQYCNSENSYCNLDNTSNIKALNGGQDLGGTLYDLASGTTGDDSAVQTSLILQDGSAIFFSIETNASAIIYIDTNGNKGPNTIGRDFFMLWMLDYRYMNKYILQPMGFFIESSRPPLTLQDISEDESNPWNCIAGSQSSMGIGCGARLLLEGAMKY